MAWRLLHMIVQAAPRIAITIASREDLLEFSALRDAAAAPRLVGSCRVAPAFSLLEVSLLPLSAHAVGSLLAEALRAPSPLDLDIARRVHQRCGGNPLFILSLAAKLSQDLRGLPLAEPLAPVPTSLDAMLVATLEQKYIPSSLSEVVLAQLDRLTMQVCYTPVCPSPPATPCTPSPPYTPTPCPPLHPLHRAMLTGVSDPQDGRGSGGRITGGSSLRAERAEGHLPWPC